MLRAWRGRDDARAPPPRAGRPLPSAHPLHRHHGIWAVESARQALWQQGDAHPHARPRRSRQNHHPVQAQAESVGHHHPDRRLQRRDCHVQERKVQRLGRRRAGQDPAPVAALLHGDAGARLCRRLAGPRAHRRGAHRAPQDPQRPRDEGLPPPRLCQQAGSARCDDAHRGDGEARAAEDEGPQLVLPPVQCARRRGALRGPQLALAEYQVAEIVAFPHHRLCLRLSTPARAPTRRTPSPSCPITPHIPSCSPTPARSPPSSGLRPVASPPRTIPLRAASRLSHFLVCSVPVSLPLTHSPVVLLGPTPSPLSFRRFSSSVYRL